MAKKPPNNRAAAKARRDKLDKKKQKFKGHGMQYNLPTAADMYAPARDFAHNYPAMIQSIIRAFNTDYWPALFGWLAEEYMRLNPDDTAEDCQNGAFDDLEAAKDVYCKFLSSCCEDPEESVEDVLTRAGWNQVPLPVQMAWFSMMGQVMTGQLFAGVRDLTPLGGKGGKIEEIKHFIEAGQKARRELNGIGEPVEVQNHLREAVRAVRGLGMTFDQIHEIVDDVKFGRV